MLIFILAVIAFTRKMPPKPPEDSLEAVNLSVLEGNNSTGRSELLIMIATDGITLTSPSDKKSILSVILPFFYHKYFVGDLVNSLLFFCGPPRNALLGHIT